MLRFVMCRNLARAKENLTMTDIEFLKELKERKVKWTVDALTTATRLMHIGFLRYETGLHSAWFEITDHGEKYLNT